MSTSIDEIDNVLGEIDREIESLETPQKYKINIVKANDNRYIILFDGQEKECKHAKHIAHIKMYDFVFCKATKQPICVYCGPEIETEKDALEVISALTEDYSMVIDFLKSNSRFGSPYFKELIAAFVNSEELNVLES